MAASSAPKAAITAPMTKETTDGAYFIAFPLWNLARLLQNGIRAPVNI
jgi:hypothetical protein